MQIYLFCPNFVNFAILYSKLVIVMEMGQMVLHVMPMEYAVVKPIS